MILLDPKERTFPEELPVQRPWGVWSRDARPTLLEDSPSIKQGWCSRIITLLCGKDMLKCQEAFGKEKPNKKYTKDVFMLF